MQILVDLPAAAAPALRAIVERWSEQAGEKLTYPMGDASGQAKMTQAMTNAAIALGALRKAVNAAVPKADPHLRG